MEKIPEGPTGFPPEKENKEEQRDLEKAAAERQFLTALLSEAKDAQEKSADRLFAQSREFIGEIMGTAIAEGLKPFLEHAAKYADLKTQEAAKAALARLELGKT